MFGQEKKYLQSELAKCKEELLQKEHILADYEKQIANLNKQLDIKEKEIEALKAQHREEKIKWVKYNNSLVASSKEQDSAKHINASHYQIGERQNLSAEGVSKSHKSELDNLLQKHYDDKELKTKILGAELSRSLKKEHNVTLVDYSLSISESKINKQILHQLLMQIPSAVQYCSNQNHDAIEKIEWRSSLCVVDNNYHPIILIMCIGDNYGVSFIDEEKDNTCFVDDVNEPALDRVEVFVWCYLKNRILSRVKLEWNNPIELGINRISDMIIDDSDIAERAYKVLSKSNYGGIFEKQISCAYADGMLVVDYELPNKEVYNSINKYIYNKSSNKIVEQKFSNREIEEVYENALYSIALRSIYEIFVTDNPSSIQSITFNGFVSMINVATGQMGRECIMSVQVSREKFMSLDLRKVDPKACFKGLKGVAGARIVEMLPIPPILVFNKNDRRFVEGRSVSVNQGTNLAAMHWEDFEHLVRELFELEFASKGGEVRVTKASRDGGVDAVVFDPDPIRGGKIVVQAKRYTNTVGVSAVRDLYGTVINEGANSGILITTSDYGHDSYEFAKDKPLKLLNGAHLLALLKKNGHVGYIDIDEAKSII